MEIAEVLAEYKNELAEVESFMERHIASGIKLISEVAGHLITSGGKRIRPLLHLISSQLCGYAGGERFPLAAAIEYIHTATLLHDDVIDEALVRRGKASANVVWGNAVSVLVGDYLYSKAFSLLAETGDLRLIRLMSQMTNIMSEGEVFQLMKSGDANLTEEEYFSIVEKKTAVLISAACESGAVMGQVDEGRAAALRNYGYKIGMAFQIVDDTLDYMATQEDFGKAIGKDLEEGKMTLPLIYTLAHCLAADREMVRAAIEKKELVPDVAGNIFTLIHKSGGIDYALQRADNFIREAAQELEIFDDCREKEELLAVAAHVIARKT